ncbi:MAG: amidohydrolase [bacterium]|nr:amidohydrolase [bacterium]
MSMLDEITSKSEEISDRLITFRREIHKNPELSGEEKNSSSFVAGVLEANDIEVRRNVGGYGLVAILNGGLDGPLVGLRADMDALPIEEQTGAEYASLTPGVMHACGHDVHTAILIGAAIVLGGMRERLKGRVMFLFQPAEESINGARAMIADGVYDGELPGAVVALHCLPEMEVGRIGHKPGIMTAAADSIDIVIKGKSGHASRPHQTVDAVLVSSMVISAIHHIVSRRTNPLHPAVISIGSISGGSAKNIIADRVEMEGTVRTLDKDLREKMPEIIEGVIKGVTASMGAEYEFSYTFECPAVINDPVVDELVSSCASDIVGSENSIELGEPMMGSEDFALFTEKAPGVLFRLGTGNREKGIVASLHNPHFDIDEEAIIIGTKMMSWIAARYLNKK